MNAIANVIASPITNTNRNTDTITHKNTDADTDTNTEADADTNANAKIDIDTGSRADAHVHAIKILSAFTGPTITQENFSVGRGRTKTEFSRVRQSSCLTAKCS